MGNKMTSTPYGLKVKEHTNHADYKDIFEDTVFKIYYNESTHVWTIKSNYDRLWSEGIQYLKGDTILEFTNTLTQEKTVLGQYDQEGTEVYRNIMYRIKCYQGEAGAGATKQLVQITGGYSSKTYDKETVCTDILHTHTSVYYNGKWHVGMYLLYDNPSIANCWMKKVGSLAITYAKPYWFLMTTQAGIEYGGQVYEARKLIRSWSPDEFVNMSLYYHKIRKRELPNPDTDRFDKLVYDVQCFAPDGRVTLTYEINSVSQDSVTFYPSDSPVRFHNIEFSASSDKWTIYSKCGYIKFDGKTYKTNKSIFSVGFDEDLHVEIKDESNIYEIEETTTYTVKSVQVGSISYKLWTTTIDKAIKVEKTVDTVIEPWITVRYYEAMYEPVTIDDLILEFSNVDMKWYLKSNNDDLYCNGSNYSKGELIDYWDYEYIQNLKYITVLVTSAEDGIEIKKISSGDIPYLNNDIDEVYDDGLKICHSSTKGLWEIVSVDDETYYNGIRFLEGQTIVSFRDKTILDQFTILVKKIIPGEEEYDNVMYTCYTGVDLINGITTLTVNGMSWADKAATDANKSVIVTKDTARSMYGYIWQKEETPPPHPWASFDFIILRDNAWHVRYVKIKMEDGHIVASSGYLTSGEYYRYPYGLGLFYSNYLNELYLGGNGAGGIKITFNEDHNPEVTRYTNFYRMPTDEGVTWCYGIISNGTAITFSTVQENNNYYLKKYITNTTNDIPVTELIQVDYDFFFFDNPTETFYINNKLYFLVNFESGNNVFGIIYTDTVSTNIYRYGQDNFVRPLLETLEEMYPSGNPGFSFIGNCYSSFEYGGYIYKFVSYHYTVSDDRPTFKLGLIKINASNGNWSFLSLSNTELNSDIPIHSPWDYSNINSIYTIVYGGRIFLYINWWNYTFDPYTQSLYVYEVVFGSGGIQINRINRFDQDDYIEFKDTSNNTVRCYPMGESYYWDSSIGCYRFGLSNGASINRQTYVDTGNGENTVNYSNGLLSNLGKAIYAIGDYYTGSYISTTRRFIARLGSLDLTSSPENQIALFG